MSSDDNPWSFNLRNARAWDSDSDSKEEQEDAHGVSQKKQRQFDISLREDTVDYKPNPFSRAKINAATRAQHKLSVSKQPALKGPDDVRTEAPSSTSTSATHQVPAFNARQYFAMKRSNHQASAKSSRITMHAPPAKTKQSGPLFDGFKKQAQRAAATTRTTRSPPLLPGDLNKTAAVEDVELDAARSSLSPRLRSDYLIPEHSSTAADSTGASDFSAHTTTAFKTNVAPLTEPLFSTDPHAYNLNRPCSFSSPPISHGRSRTPCTDPHTIYSSPLQHSASFQPDADPRTRTRYMREPSPLIRAPNGLEHAPFLARSVASEPLQEDNYMYSSTPTLSSPNSLGYSKSEVESPPVRTPAEYRGVIVPGQGAFSCVADSKLIVSMG